MDFEPADGPLSNRCLLPPNRTGADRSPPADSRMHPCGARRPIATPGLAGPTKLNGFASRRVRLNERREAGGPHHLRILVNVI